MNSNKLVQTVSDQELINYYIRNNEYHDCEYKRMCLFTKI